MGLQLDRLYDLQRLDSRIEELTNKLNSLDDGSAISQQLEGRKAELTKLQNSLRVTRRKLKDRELELQGTEAKLKDLQDSIYSGKVSNPKELLALQKEVEILNATKDKLESEALELMELVDLQESDFNNLKEHTENLEQQLSEAKQNYQRELLRTKTELEDLTGRRRELADLIPEDKLRRYEELRQKADNLAVVRIIDDACSGCKVQLPEAQIKRLMAGSDELIACQNCGRILYYGE